MSRKTILWSTAGVLIVISFLLFKTGVNIVKSDIARFIHNSGPKSPDDVYALLLKKPVDSCMTVIRFKDQVVPKIDCCIWMELKLCRAELNRIIALVPYQKTILKSTDSLAFMTPFNARPIWWTPQLSGDRITKHMIKFNERQRTYLFFGDDSTHIFVCDQAL